MRILLIEDDRYLAESIAEALSAEQFRVDVATDGVMGLHQAGSQLYDLILLDVTLPRLDGLQVCQQLRAQGITLPVIMLTARDTRTDKVLGLDAGADVYMVKPVDLQELLAQVRASLRRGQGYTTSELRWGSLCLNPRTYEVFYGQRLVSLTPKEFAILTLLMQRGRTVLERYVILDQLWPVGDPPSEETVKAHIKGLRNKLSQAGAPRDFIETVYGIGYRLGAESVESH